jgi:tetratricopeptide (TPR) repeat protein
VLVQAQRDSDDLQAAQRSGEQLLALAGKLNEPVTSMHAEEAVGSVLLILERYPEALDHFQKALTFSHQAKQPELGYLLECADASWRLGDYEEAKRFLAALPPVSRANSGTSYVDEIMSAMLLSRKRYAEAKGIAVRALADPKCQDPGFFYRLSAQIEAASGSPAKAQERATKALTQAKSESDNYALAASNLALANAYLAGGAAAKGLPFAQSAHDYFAASGRRESEYLSLLSLAKICRLTNDVASSKTFAQKGLDIFSEFNHNWVPQRYESYLKRQDVHGVLAELELIRRQ